MHKCLFSHRLDSFVGVIRLCDVLTIIAGGCAAGLGHVGLVEGGEAGEVAGRVERVQGGVDRGRQQRVLQSSATGHEVESLESLLQQIWCIRHQRESDELVSVH